MPPQQTTRSIGTPCSRQPLDDGARAERRRLDQRAVHLGARRVQRLAHQQARQPRVHQDRAVPVVPVEREEPARAGPAPRGLRREARVEPRVALADPGRPTSAAGRPPPTARPRARSSRASPSRGRCRRCPGRRPSRSASGATAHVAGGGADDLDQGAGLHPRADRAVVRVEAAHRDRDAGREPQLLRPRGREAPRGAVGGEGLRVEALAQRREPRIEPREERGVGKAVPAPRRTSPCGPRRRRSAGSPWDRSRRPARRARSPPAPPSCTLPRTRRARP